MPTLADTKSQAMGYSLLHVNVGLFLGYPVDDVTGFIQNKGRNYLLCGYWKVYSDENRARRIFSNYDKCRNYLCNKLAQGESIYQALKIS